MVNKCNMGVTNKYWDTIIRTKYFLGNHRNELVTVDLKILVIFSIQKEDTQ